MFKHSIRSLPLLGVLVATLAQAALGPTNPPPQLAGKEGAKLWKEATTLARAAAKVAHTFNPKSNIQCLEAVFLRRFASIGAMDTPEDGLPATIQKGKRPDFYKALDKNRDDECSGGDDGGATVQAMADFSVKNPYWDESTKGAFRGPPVESSALPAPFAGERGEAIRYLYGRFAPSMTPTSPSVLEMLKLGILVPVSEGAAAAAATVMLPILNPEMFMRRQEPKPGEVY
ncbi:hypothetical protein ACN28E_25050 [Archangium lansingense]|uniref:hypothetical protein n=1 Tax=Archangium lansingense TaxID=2995310 RepID=UPI003B80C48A